MNKKALSCILVLSIGILMGYCIVATKYIWLRELQLEQYQTLTECQYSEEGYFEYWKKCKDICK